MQLITVEWRQRDSGHLITTAILTRLLRDKLKSAYWNKRLNQNWPKTFKNKQLPINDDICKL